MIAYRAEVDGLRALAVLPVMLFHAGASALPGGFVGVDVFFVISGYLITSIIVAEREAGTFTLAGFWERRARRILPPLFVVMIACLPAAWVWLLPHDARDFARSAAAVAVFASNILFWRESGYFSAAAELKPLLHTWSLAVEEQYYLLFPLAVLLGWRLGRRGLLVAFALAATLSFALALWLVPARPVAAFFLLPTRGWELLVGAMLALAARPGGAAPGVAVARPLAELGAATGLALIAYAVFAFGPSTPFPGPPALVPTLGAALAIAFATPATLAGRLLGARPLVQVGLLSYSAYLWHQPLLAFARHASLDDPPRPLMFALAAAALPIAWLSWRFVERPFRDRRRVSRRTVLVLGLGFSALFVTLGLAAGSAAMLNARLAAQPALAAIQGLAERSRLGPAACDAQLAAQRGISPGCALGAAGAERRFALFGDSHARALFDALDEAAREAGLAGVAYMSEACPPLLTTDSLHDDVPARRCRRLRDDFFAKLATPEVAPVVVMHSRWTMVMEHVRFDNGEGGHEPGAPASWEGAGSATLGHEAALAADFARSVRAVLDSGRAVVLVYPVPEAGWDVPRRMMKQLRAGVPLAPADASTSVQAYRRRTERARAALDAIGTHPRLHRVDPAAHLCDAEVAGRCVTQAGGVPLYFDDNHLSRVGARRVADAIVPLLRAGTR